MAKLTTKPTNTILAEYLYLVAMHASTDIKSSCRGTTVPHVSPGALTALALTLPPLSEQKRIVDVLASVTSYIAALQQQATDARAARNAVLHELLSAVGDDWTETTLGAIAEVVGGGTPATSNPAYWDGDIVWLTPTEVVAASGSVLTNSARKITEAGLKSSGARLIPEGAVILTSRASVGFSALAGTSLATNQGFQSLIPSPQVNNRFLMFWIQNNQQEFNSRAAGSTFKEISKANVKSILITLPPFSKQKQIVEVVSAMDHIVNATEQTVTEAHKLRSGLLSGLLSGEHEIPESYDRLLGAA
jgi:type I restriction enzyme S subunit